MLLRAWNLQNLFIVHTNKNLIKIGHADEKLDCVMPDML